MKSGLKNCWLSLAAVAAVNLGAISTAHAESLEFTLDASQTSLTLTEVFLNSLGLNLVPQEPGVSDVSTLEGTILVDVDDIGNPATIEFMGGDMVMQDNGTWLPDLAGGTFGDPGTPQPGGYGTQFEDAGIGVFFYSAFRDAHMSLVMYDESDFGDPIVPDPIPVTAGSFPWDDVNSRVLVDLGEGTWDWNLTGSFGDDFDDQPILDADNLNLASTNGTYVVDGNTVTLTLPFAARMGESPNGDPELLLANFEGVLVATATIGGIGGDFNNDDIVDGDDFLIWQAGFGSPGDHSMGDANLDGTVDGDDFLIWQAQFGGPPSGGSSGAVPEPASIAILAVMALAAASMRKRLG